MTYNEATFFIVKIESVLKKGGDLEIKTQYKDDMEADRSWPETWVFQDFEDLSICDWEKFFNDWARKLASDVSQKELRQLAKHADAPAAAPTGISDYDHLSADEFKRRMKMLISHNNAAGPSLSERIRQFNA